ncbi:MAG: type I phosphomannose isomerase catalytic subunit [Bacillota bacterium]
MNLYPLKFKPVYKEKIWGGNKISKFFKRKLSRENIGESWEVTAHPNGVSVVKNGFLQGKKITDLIKESRKDLLGQVNIDTGGNFPLLIKFLDANQKLSVQVHPDNNYAQKVEGEPGKTEMWYIIDCEPEAKLVYGLKPGTTRREMKKAIKQGNLENLLNEITVKPGEVYFIPSGTIHAIEEGILLAEIQQNSDTTYRVYDWNRTDAEGKSRPLHIDNALEVANFQQKPSSIKNKILTITTQNYNRHFLAACPYFVTEKLELQNSCNLKSEFTENKFIILMILDGSGEIIHKNTKYQIKAGETIMIPAALKEIALQGNLNLLKTYIPENKSDFITKLSNLNFSREEINQLAGIKSW